MGQAKARGTREDRVAAAVKRDPKEFIESRRMPTGKGRAAALALIAALGMAPVNISSGPQQKRRF